PPLGRPRGAARAGADGGRHGPPRARRASRATALRPNRRRGDRARVHDHGGGGARAWALLQPGAGGGGHLRRGDPPPRSGAKLTLPRGDEYTAIVFDHAARRRSAPRVLGRPRSPAQGVSARRVACWRAVAIGAAVIFLLLRGGGTQGALPGDP